MIFSFTYWNMIKLWRYMFGAPPPTEYTINLNLCIKTIDDDNDDEEGGEIKTQSQH